MKYHLCLVITSRSCWDKWVQEKKLFYGIKFYLQNSPWIECNLRKLSVLYKFEASRRHNYHFRIYDYIVDTRKIWTYRLKQKLFWIFYETSFPPLTSFTLVHVPYECKFNLHKWNFNQNGKKNFTCYKTHKGRLVTDKYLSKQLYII